MDLCYDSTAKNDVVPIACLISLSRGHSIITQLPFSPFHEGNILPQD